MSKKKKKQKQAKANFNEVTAAGSSTMSKAFSDKDMEATVENIKTWRRFLRDAQVGSVWEQRQSGVTGVDWEVYPASEEARDVAAAEFIKDQIEKIGFDLLTRKMHFAQFYGYAVAECLWVKEDSKIVFDTIKVRAAERFKWKGGELLFTGGGNPQGDPLPEVKMWFYAIPGDSDDVPHGPTLGWRLYWPVFLKENGATFWAVYVEKYGMPTAIGHHPGMADQKEIDNLVQALMSIHSQSAVAFPEGFTAELLQSMKSSGGEYEAFQSYWDKAVSKVILSQTMTTDDGSSQSQANVHERVADSIIQSDADLICDSFNRGPIKWLTEWNFPGANPPQVWRRISQEESLNDMAERDERVANATGYRRTLEDVKDRYGGEWEERPQTVSALQSDEKASFADPDPALDDVDSLVNQLDDLTQPMTEKLIGEVRNIVFTSTSFAEIETRLLQLAADSENEELAQMLAGGMSVADLTGRADEL
ncbi:DUF935 family protein [Terasakiella sp. A23]|uniref:DUF935 domain-containing protein n=1 Tax=Terasakiella sp. FCG-A23 TaxID=3080561 RepID=UPI002953A8BE|nr:DUF935 family protein [Terasakiella sp. A23]MDV7340982.1 DUF935 family protein [Terasakiella sp. A23]